jgi:FkbM family methyltransferase
MPRFTETAITMHGRRLAIADSASFVSMYQEIFKKEIYAFAADSDSPRIIDAGANIGLATIYFKQRYPAATVVAFEPDPRIAGILRKNIESFGLSGIEVVERGLWSAEGSLSFISDGADGGRVEASAHAGAYSIPVTRLRPYLDARVDFLKIDIEGSEGEVLADVADLLKNVKNLFVEFHSFASRPQDLEGILRGMQIAGFRYYIESIGAASSRPFIARERSGDMDLQLNIWAYRP